ncbi:hypothetical protein FN846DRAFT_991535 [Sphaerosporella brunnea]|uniref:Uncharacterized protein n=1 Tax=Sphaerosporella brunnea TaxID=1250544 RepID=A0A5J5EMS0_9PEZI|nr:hypothetical protein FN846DRAFT_991535 [Sphaerosporella brunnea]
MPTVDGEGVSQLPSIVQTAETANETREASSQGGNNENRAPTPTIQLFWRLPPPQSLMSACEEDDRLLEAINKTGGHIATQRTTTIVAAIYQLNMQTQRQIADVTTVLTRKIAALEGVMVRQSDNSSLINRIEALEKAIAQNVGRRPTSTPAFASVPATEVGRVLTAHTSPLQAINAKPRQAWFDDPGEDIEMTLAEAERKNAADLLNQPPHSLNGVPSSSSSGTTGWDTWQPRYPSSTVGASG